MKIIGKSGSSTYICEISHDEIEKVFNLYYGNLKKDIKVGDDINLGAGYSFRDDIKGACERMIDASKKFQTAQDTMMQFAVMVSNLPAAED